MAESEPPEDAEFMHLNDDGTTDLPNINPYARVAMIHLQTAAGLLSVLDEDATPEDASFAMEAQQATAGLANAYAQLAVAYEMKLSREKPFG